jgi:hypothetical protein
MSRARRLLNVTGLPVSSDASGMRKQPEKKPKYEVIIQGGFKFFFKYEEDYPDVLHIWARHLKEPKDAIRIWFMRGETYNRVDDRFEIHTDTEGIFWKWLDPEKTKILIISCFTRYNK